MAECWHVALTLPRHREKPNLQSTVKMSAHLAPWYSCIKGSFASL